MDQMMSKVQGEAAHIKSVLILRAVGYIKYALVITATVLLSMNNPALAGVVAVPATICLSGAQSIAEYTVNKAVAKMEEKGTEMADQAKEKAKEKAVATAKKAVTAKKKDEPADARVRPLEA